MSEEGAELGVVELEVVPKSLIFSGGRFFFRGNCLSDVGLVLFFVLLGKSYPIDNSRSLAGDVVGELFIFIDWIRVGFRNDLSCFLVHRTSSPIDKRTSAGYLILKLQQCNDETGTEVFIVSDKFSSLVDEPGNEKRKEEGDDDGESSEDGEDCFESRESAIILKPGHEGIKQVGSDAGYCQGNQDGLEEAENLPGKPNETDDNDSEKHDREACGGGPEGAFLKVVGVRHSEVRLANAIAEKSESPKTGKYCK